MSEILKALKERFDEEQILINEPMKKHTSFKIGGNADIFIKPKTKEELAFAIELCKSKNFSYYLIGNGSNLLVSDKGIRGAVIQLYKNFSEIEIKNNEIKAQSGALLSRIANEALKNNFEGFEFASGIPGTLGGAVCMNAGAYGGEMKQVVKAVEVYLNGKFKWLSNSEAEFEYRNSKILKNKMIVVSAVIELEKGNSDKIKQRMIELNKQRAEKQPLEFPSAGSTFKRPEGFFAGKLIMDAGLSGFSIGDAQISEKHCGFVVNKGNATCSDVMELIEHTKNKVFEKFNVVLEPEVRIIGEF